MLRRLAGRPEMYLSAPISPSKNSSSGDWKWMALLAIPLACCGLPLIIAAVATTGALVLGGVAAAALALVAGSFIVVVHYRRRCATTTTSASIHKAEG